MTKAGNKAYQGQVYVGSYQHLETSISELRARIEHLESRIEDLEDEAEKNRAEDLEYELEREQAVPVQLPIETTNFVPIYTITTNPQPWAPSTVPNNSLYTFEVPSNFWHYSQGWYSR